MVIAVVAILVGVATTSFKSITTSSRITGEINGLLGDMQYARSEAIRQGTNVVVCVAKSDGSDCVANDTNWQEGLDRVHRLSQSEEDQRRDEPGAAPAGALHRHDAGHPVGQSDQPRFVRPRGLALGLLATMSGAGGAIIPLHDPTNNATKTRCLWITNIGSVSVQQPSTLPNCT